VIVTASRTGADAERVTSSLMFNLAQARELHTRLGEALDEQEAIAAAKATIKAQRQAA
jgi:hypothetical protein